MKGTIIVSRLFLLLSEQRMHIGFLVRTFGLIDSDRNCLKGFYQEAKLIKNRHVKWMLKLKCLDYFSHTPQVSNSIKIHSAVLEL